MKITVLNKNTYRSVSIDDLTVIPDDIFTETYQSFLSFKSNLFSLGFKLSSSEVEFLNKKSYEFLLESEKRYNKEKNGVSLT